MRLEKRPRSMVLRLSLGAIFILRKGKGVGRWYSKILTIPYRGRWVVLDHPYVRKHIGRNPRFDREGHWAEIGNIGQTYGTLGRY